MLWLALVSRLPEIMFAHAENETATAFNEEHVVSSGLQETVMLYPGFIYRDVSSQFSFAELVRSGRVSGLSRFDQLVQRSIFGLGLSRNVRHTPTSESYIVAAHVNGSRAPGGIGGATDSASVNTIVIADVDMISERFFAIRAEGIKTLQFDNISFFLNCIDMLIGDESFIELRKKRPHHRTLEAVEEQTSEFYERRVAEEQAADQQARQAIEDAQQRLNDRVAPTHEAI